MGFMTRRSPPVSAVPAPPPQHRSRAEHLKLDEVVGYLERVLHPGVRRTVEQHLVECEVCCLEIIEVTRVLVGGVCRR
jgi:hypothetical protein